MVISLTDMLLEPIDPILKGIQDYAEEKKLSVLGVDVSDIIWTNQPVEPMEPNPRYIINPQTAITFINDIRIDRCYGINTDNSFKAVDHTTDNGFQFTEAKIRQKRPFSLTCRFSTEDHKEKMKRLNELAESDQPLTLFFNGEVYESLMVISISETINNVLYTQFTLNLREYQTVGVEKIPSPHAKKLVGEPKVKKTGKQSTIKTIYSGPPTPEMTREQVVNANLPGYASRALLGGA